MKKRFKNSLAALVMVLVVQVGCKSGSPETPVPLPNLADFTITGATPFAVGTTSTISIYCTSIGSGTYMAHFNLAGADTFNSQSATLVMSGGTGSFQTPVLPNPGTVYLTISSITNINGGGSGFPSNSTNNTYTISDSTGSMTATVGGANLFNARDVLATITNGQLTIRGEVDEPTLTIISMVIDSFNHQTGVINFSSRDIPEIAHFLYQSPSEPKGGSYSANGTINIISISPLISGTFSFTCMDSTKITSGSFSTITPSY